MFGDSSRSVLIGQQSNIFDTIDVTKVSIWILRVEDSSIIHVRRTFVRTFCRDWNVL